MTCAQSPDLNLLSPVEYIKARAKNLGFCLCGVTNAEPLSEYPRYESWLAADRHGAMSYLASDRHRLLRRDPKFLTPWVKSIIVFAWPYDLNYTIEAENAGQIAGYVGEKDYHELIPNILQGLINELPALLNQEIRSEIFCDTAPILERELAARAGLGWIGKNSNLINPTFGSAFLLAEVFIDYDLPADLPFTKDLCGNCHKCIDACPVACILPDRTIDASRCISALTIETKGLIPQPIQKTIGNHLFGCDICQAVCPWNQKNKETNIKNVGFSEKEMISFLFSDETSFRARFRHTAFWRSKRTGFVRNLCTVLGNFPGSASQSGMAQLVTNDADPIICISAAIALMKINSDLARKKIAERLILEVNPQIIQELTVLIK